MRKVLVTFLFLLFSSVLVADVGVQLWQENSYIKRYELDYARVCREKFPKTVEDLQNIKCQNIEGIFDLLHSNREKIGKISQEITESFDLKTLKECRKKTKQCRDCMMDYLDCLQDQAIIPFDVAVGGSFFDEDHREMEKLLTKAKMLISVEKVASFRCDFTIKDLMFVDGKVQKSTTDSKACNRDYDPLKEEIGPLLDKKRKNKFPFTTKGHYLKQFQKKFVTDKNKSDFEKCANLYSFPVLRPSEEESSHARSCLKVCSKHQQTNFCQEVAKLPEVEKEREKDISFAGCLDEFYQARRIGEQGVSFGTNFTERELISDMLAQVDCPGDDIFQIVDSYEDLERIRQRVASGDHPLDFWLDALLRTTAVQKQIKNHCDVFGGPFDIDPETCPEFKNSFQKMLQHPTCKKKKALNFSFAKMEYVKNLVDKNRAQLQKKLSEYEEISGIIDGGTYYLQKGLSYITSKIKNPTAYAERLEKQIKEARMTLVKLAGQFPHFFVGADFDELTFPVIDRFDPYELRQEDHLLELEKYSRARAKRNAKKFLGDLCNRETVTLTDLFRAPNLVDKMRKRFPRYEEVLTCYQNQSEARDDFLMGMKVMGMVSCVGLSLGPQAAVVAPICTAVGIGDATASYLDDRHNLKFQQNCYSNTKLCESEDLVRAVESFNSSLNNLHLEFWMAPFFVSELKDLMKAGRLATKVSPQKFKSFVSNLSPEEAIKIEQRLRKGELSQDQLVDLVHRSTSSKVGAKVIDPELAKQLELDIFKQLGLDFMAPGLKSSLSAKTLKSLSNLQKKILENPVLKNNLVKAIKRLGDTGKAKVKNFLISLAELPQKSIDLVVNYLSGKKLTSNDIAKYIDDINIGSRACSVF